MGLTLITPPALEPVSLAEARAHCRIATNDEDALLAGYILAARVHAERFTRRAFMTQTWSMTLDDDWPQVRDPATRCAHDRIILPRPPTISVSSIQYVDDAGATQTLASNQHRLVKLETGEWAIDPAYDVTWPTVRRQSAAITVTFIAGYGGSVASLLEFEPIRQAMLLLISHWFENREAVNVGNIVTEMPMAVDRLLSDYRVFY